MWCNAYGNVAISLKKNPNVVSFNDSSYHGSWNYVWDEVEELGSFTIAFNCVGDAYKMKQHDMKQIRGTVAFSDGSGCTMVPFALPTPPPTPH
jgi:hypothetical protein